MIFFTFIICKYIACTFRISNQRIMELEARMEDFTESSVTTSVSDQATVTNIRTKLYNAQQTISKQQQDIHEKSQKLDELDDVSSK